MPNTLNKENLIKLVDSLKYEGPVVDEIKLFIQSYDGTNVDDFNMLIFALVTFIMGVQETEVRADGYDAMEYENALFDEQMDELKKKYEKLNSGQLPTEPYTDRAGSSTTTQE